jgi:protein-tyrosine phosphatase
LSIAGDSWPDGDERRLTWDGCFNVRDLGGLPTGAGAQTRWGEVIRSDTRERLTPAGWAAARRYGVTTVVDLRGASELDLSRPVPVGMVLVSAPVLDMRDDEFWNDGRWRGAGQTARFFLAALERWPERFAAAVTAVARARPGGVLIHCQAGRDRTGVVAAAILALVGVERESIVSDYALSADRLQPLYNGWFSEAADQETRDRITRANRSDPEEIRNVLASIDLASHLLDNGLATADAARLRERLLGADLS